MDYESIKALNWSSLREIAVSPRQYQHRMSAPREDTRAMALGRAVHAFVLEPERFTRDYGVMPDFGDQRTKAAKEAKAAWVADLRPGVEYLPIDDYEGVIGMGAAVADHRVARDVLSGVRAEVVATWSDSGTGLACKGRLDGIAGGRVVELKSARSVGRRFCADAADRLYHGQVAYYHDGAIAAGLLPADAPPPVIVAVASAAPYDVQVLELSAATLEAGRALYRSCLARWQECEAAGVWPGCAPDLQVWDLPGWALGVADTVAPPEGDESEATW